MTEIEHALALANVLEAAAARGDDGTLSPTDAALAAKSLRAWAEAKAMRKALAL